MKSWEGGRITPSQQRELIQILEEMIETVHTMIKMQHRSNQDEVETEVFLIR